MKCDLRGYSPLVGPWDKDGRSLDNPPLNVPLLLFVDDQEVVGVQFNGFLQIHTLHLQAVHKHLTGPGDTEISVYRRALSAGLPRGGGVNVWLHSSWWDLNLGLHEIPTNHKSLPYLWLCNVVTPTCNIPVSPYL